MYYGVTHHLILSVVETHDISHVVGSGAGSWTRPYELNIADPLLLAVAFSSQGSQGPIGSQRIYSLVCHWVKHVDGSENPKANHCLDGAKT